MLGRKVGRVRRVVPWLIMKESSSLITVVVIGCNYYGRQLF